MGSNTSSFCLVLILSEVPRAVWSFPEVGGASGSSPETEASVAMESVGNQVPRAGPYWLWPGGPHVRCPSVGRPTGHRPRAWRERSLPGDGSSCPVPGTAWHHSRSQRGQTLGVLGRCLAVGQSRRDVRGQVLHQRPLCQGWVPRVAPWCAFQGAAGAREMACVH